MELRKYHRLTRKWKQILITKDAISQLSHYRHRILIDPNFRIPDSVFRLRQAQFKVSTHYFVVLSSTHPQGLQDRHRRAKVKS